MPCKILLSTGNPTSNIQRKEYLIDNESEITLLPTAKTIGKFQDGSEELNEKCEVGSTALVCETSEAYILSPSNVWKKL